MLCYLASGFDVFCKIVAPYCIGANSLMQGCRNFVRAHAQIVCKEILVPKSTSPRLLAIPAFDLIAGLCNRHLNSDRGNAYTNDLEVRLKALNDLAKK